MGELYEQYRILGCCNPTPGNACGEEIFPSCKECWKDRMKELITENKKLKTEGMIMKLEKMKELRSVIGLTILDLEEIYCHHQDGSDLAVNEHELFDIIMKVIGSQPVRKFRKGLHKALDIVEEEMGIDPRTCDILGQKMTRSDFE